MASFIRYGLALSVAVLFASMTGFYPRLGFLFGWWGGFSWLLITKQWRPLA